MLLWALQKPRLLRLSYIEFPWKQLLWLVYRRFVERLWAALVKEWGKQAGQRETLNWDDVAEAAGNLHGLWYWVGLSGEGLILWNLLWTSHWMPQILRRGSSIWLRADPRTVISIHSQILVPHFWRREPSGPPLHPPQPNPRVHLFHTVKYPPLETTPSKFWLISFSYETWWRKVSGSSSTPCHCSCQDITADIHCLFPLLPILDFSQSNLTLLPLYVAYWHGDLDWSLRVPSPWWPYPSLSTAVVVLHFLSKLDRRVLKDTQWLPKCQPYSSLPPLYKRSFLFLIIKIINLTNSVTLFLAYWFLGAKDSKKLGGSCGLKFSRTWTMSLVEAFASGNQDLLIPGA